MSAKTETTSKPNVLMIMVDQMRYPLPDGCGGFADDIKKILSFKQPASTEWDQFFPGFRRLREHSVVFHNHMIATSACVPSRTAIFSGQHCRTTGVTQTDGMFKEGKSEKFPWLKPSEFPTVGHWMRAAGYTTHYFGKSHLAPAGQQSLEALGFADWERSFPDPHGTLINNMGFYRDPQFADEAVAFLRRKALGIDLAVEHASGEEPEPWFAVVSFTNPHDIATYPGLTQVINEVDRKDFLTPQPIPTRDMVSKTPDTGTTGMPLNPQGFGEEKPPARLPSSWNEEVELRPSTQNRTKPIAQYEYAYKLGMGFAAKGINNSEALEAHAPQARRWNYPMPFIMTQQPRQWTAAFVRYYAYCLHVVDQHIARILNALDTLGLRDNTIVLFTPDHGEYGGSHMMMSQKWHSAYQEMLHVPMVVSSPRANENEATPRDCNALTSHIDILPTIVGFSGENPDMGAAPPPVGLNLAPYILDSGADESMIRGNEGDGVLFVCDDEPLKPLYQDESETTLIDEEVSRTVNDEYRIFETLVERWAGEYDLQQGPVAQPACVECYCTSDWKFVRYVDRAGDSGLEHFELYHRASDPAETHNCLRYDDFSSIIYVPPGLQESDVRAAADDLLARLTTELAAIEPS